MVILAKALYKFEGTQSEDMSFEEDEIVTVLEKDESGWWRGRNEAGKEGEFPFNYVEVMDEAATQAYLKKRAADDGSTVAFKGDHVDTIELKKHEVVAGKGGVVVIESSLNNGTRESITKTLTELRAFDQQLRTVLPDFEGSLPPSWADKALLSDAMLERRKEAIDAYLQKLVVQDGADFLLVPFCFPGRKAELSEEGFAAAARAQAAAKAMPKKSDNAAPTLARAEYSWDPTDAVELRLEQGDLVAVLSQATASDGWWDGQTADGGRGLFPYNHIELLNAAQVQLVLEGKPLPPLASEASQGGSSAAPGGKKKSHVIKPLENRPLKWVNNFAISSVQAFDDMLDKGFAIDALSGGNGTYPKPGEEVTLLYKAHLWDCQAQAIAEFLSSDDKDEGPMEFVVDGDPSIIKGLHLAVQRIPVGASARIIVAPKVGYGVAGFPPAIPPLATLVYELTVTKSAPTQVASPRQKPVVKARMQDAPRVLSMKLMAPAPAAVHANASTKEHGPTRRAGHVVVSSAPAPAPAEDAAPAAPKPTTKYELKELQDLVKTNKADELGLDRATLEDYLTDKAFFEAFLMDRGHFLLKPMWRQQALKRAVGLF